MNTISVDDTAVEKLRGAGAEGLFVTGADGKPVAMTRPMTKEEHLAFLKDRVQTLWKEIDPEMKTDLPPEQWLTGEGLEPIGPNTRLYTIEEVLAHLRSLSK